MGREERKKIEKKWAKNTIKKKKKNCVSEKKNPFGKKRKEKKTPVINPRTDLHDHSAWLHYRYW